VQEVEGSLIVSQTLLKVLDFAGVFVFAVSGALAGGRKSLDLFGGGGPR
jgi:uncharacterized membrane protein YeiH